MKQFFTKLKAISQRKKLLIAAEVYFKRQSYLKFQSQIKMIQQLKQERYDFDIHVLNHLSVRL